MNSERMFLKAKAITYFQQSGIPKAVENCLNDLFKVNPLDPYGYLSTYFEGLSQFPTVSRIEASKCTGDIGCDAMKVKIFGVFQNEEMVLSTVSMPNKVTSTPGVHITSTYIRSHNDNIDKCVQIINEDLDNLLRGIDLRNMDEVTCILRSDGERRQAEYEETIRRDTVDSEVKEEVKTKVDSGKKSTFKKGPAVVVVPDDPPEVLCPSLAAHAAVSFAMALAASKVMKVDLYGYTSQWTKDLPEPCNPTLPMVALLRNGKGLPGKCQWIKRCLLVPNGCYDTTKKMCSDIRLLSLTVAANLQTKTPVATISEYGEMVPCYDRADQFIDVIQDALKECEMEEKMRVVVEVGARGIFDMEKGKYEVVVGQMKSGEELVAMTVDLVERYPVIIGLVDPLRTQDKDAWHSLCVSVASRCWVMGRQAHSVARAAKVSGSEDGVVAMSVMCLEVDRWSVYEDYVVCGQRLRGQAQMMAMYLDDLSSSLWPVDLACGLRVALIGLPGIRCEAGASKIDRWAELCGGGTIGSPLTFPDICQDSEPPQEGEPATAAKESL